MFLRTTQRKTEYNYKLKKWKLKWKGKEMEMEMMEATNLTASQIWILEEVFHVYLGDNPCLFDLNPDLGVPHIKLVHLN
jgi:hypothetical protein